MAVWIVFVPALMFVGPAVRGPAEPPGHEWVGAAPVPTARLPGPPSVPPGGR